MICLRHKRCRSELRGRPAAWRDQVSTWFYATYPRAFVAITLYSAFVAFAAPIMVLLPVAVLGAYMWAMADQYY